MTDNRLIFIFSKKGFTISENRARMYIN